MASILEFFKRGLQKTKTTLLRRLGSLFGGKQAWTEETYEELEAALIGTDLGAKICGQLVGDIRERYSRGEIATEEDIMRVARDTVRTILERGGELPPVARAEKGPTVILMVGVNGSGKTTTCAKLAKRFHDAGHSVLLAAGDTFRAAGVEQLKLWGERLGIPVIGGRQGGDSAAVAFDAVRAAVQRDVEYVVIDTAGRQHTRQDLMAELAKVQRVIQRELPAAPHEVWLTVDASIGSNALVQAREFGRLFPITGLILTKLDGTGKGGVVVAIKEELGYPVRFVGLGESADDLQPFDREVFVEALFSEEA